jgi:Ca2+-binding EF-hand superfamily protein
MKMETVIFGYRESFSKFYRNLGLNENENFYKKYGNGIGRKNRKRKRFELFLTVYENYRSYSVFYHR